MRLVDRVVEGSLDRQSFLRHVARLEEFESTRAEVRGGGGVTRRERAELRGEMKKLAGKMHTVTFETDPQGRASDTEVGRLYDELSNGVVSKTDAVEELNWRAMRKYGEVVAERTGPVYADERPKLRAALAPHHKTGPLTTPTASPTSYHPDTVPLIRQAITLFPQLDQDSNGVVDHSEARQILSHYQELGLTSSQAATLYSRHALLADVDSPGSASFEKMALEDLQALLPENTGLVEQGVVNHTLSQLSSRLSVFQRQTVSEQAPLYLSPEGPDGAKVRQGLEGSCWFLSALPAIDSDKLETVLTQEGEQFQMKFADGTSEAITPLNEAEQRIYSRGDGTWSGLMEKGLAQKFGKVGRTIKGGLTQEALRLLTGAQCDVFSLTSRHPHGPDLRDRDNLERLLQTSLDEGKAMFTQVHSKDFDPEVTLVSEPRHAYTITGYEPGSQTVSLRNPWGYGEKADRDGNDDGNFQMSLTELAATFSHVIVERRD